MADEDIFGELELSPELAAVAAHRAQEAGFDSVEAWISALMHDDIISKTNDNTVHQWLAQLSPEEEGALDQLLFEKMKGGS